jgi:hypothetical protein
MSCIFAFLVLFVLAFTYLYCRTKGIGNLGPERQSHVDSKASTSANGVTTFATQVSVSGQASAGPMAAAPMSAVFGTGIAGPPAGGAPEGVPPQAQPQQP